MRDARPAWQANPLPHALQNYSLPGLTCPSDEVSPSAPWCHAELAQRALCACYMWHIGRKNAPPIDVPLHTPASPERKVLKFHMHTCTCIHMHTRSCMHACSRASTHKCMRARLHACVCMCAYVRACLCACMCVLLCRVLHNRGGG